MHRGAEKQGGTIMSDKSGKLSLAVKMGFGAGDLGGNLFFTAMGFWSLFYLTDIVGIPAAAAGFAILIGKIWDAVTDPLMGFVSDRTKTRFGRRRPYLLFGSLPLFACMWWFFSAPEFSTPTGGVLWVVLVLCLLNTAYTVVNIPYGSLTPELTQDYTERNSLNGFRFSFAVVGTILGAAIVLPIVSLAGGNTRLGFSYVGFVFGLVMALSMLTTFLAVREQDRSCEAPLTERFFETFVHVFRNGMYVRLLIVYACNLTGITFVQSILVYYFKYLYHNEEMTTIAMICLLVTAMVCIPLSVVIAKITGKKRLYQLALGIISLGCIAIFLFGHILGMYYTLGVMIFAGIGIGLSYVPPFSMLPDVIEVDAVRTSQRKEGAYYGMWTFVSKIGIALAPALVGVVLAISGFIPDKTQSPETLLAIRILIGPIPLAIFIAAILVIERYPLDEKSYLRIISKVEINNEAESSR